MSSGEASIPYSVAVVDDDPKLRTRLAMQLDDDGRAASFPSLEAVEERSSGRPTVVVVGPSFASGEGFKRLGALVRSHPEMGAVLVVDQLSTPLLQQAIRAGVSDVLALPTATAQLVESVERAAEVLGPPSLSALPGGGPGELPERGRVTTVFSTKGGAGKSVIASNLAVLLSRHSEEPVVLVDADLQFGDIAVMLKLNPQRTVVDAVAAMQRLDAQLLRSLLVRHERSGVYVLPAPTEPAFADQVSAATMVRIVEILQSFCSHVVIDTPAHFNDVILALLERSDDILLVAGMDIPNIKNVKIGLQTLRLLDVPAHKVRLVLNRANAKVKLDVSEVERTLQLKADALVPSDILVPQTVNMGTPLVLDAPRSGVARSLDQLTNLLLAGAVGRRRSR